MTDDGFRRWHDGHDAGLTAFERHGDHPSPGRAAPRAQDLRLGSPPDNLLGDTLWPTPATRGGPLAARRREPRPRRLTRHPDRRARRCPARWPGAASAPSTCRRCAGWRGAVPCGVVSCAACFTWNIALSGVDAQVAGRRRSRSPVPSTALARPAALRHAARPDPPPSGVSARWDTSPAPRPALRPCVEGRLTRWRTPQAVSYTHLTL